MKALILGLVVVLSGCTMSKGIVKDVHADAKGGLVMEKCDLKGYFAFYVMVTGEENCRTEVVR